MHTEPPGFEPNGAAHHHPVAGFGEREVQAIERSDAIDSIAAPLQSWLNEGLRGPVGQKVKDFLNGTWFGHPLHPALTDIPIGTWTAATVFDLISLTTRKDLDREAEAAIAVGIAGATASAVTGLADWADTNRSQRRVGLIHAVMNSAALGLQIASFVNRRRGGSSGPALSAMGLAFAGASAWLGGNLVYRQGTQVSRTAHHRYPTSFTPAIAEAELRPERPTRAEVDGAGVMLVKHDDRIYALDDTCGHAGCPLSNGSLQGDAIVCACHGSTYRLRDGEVVRGPAPFPQPCFDVRVQGGQVEVRRRSSKV